MRLKHLLLILIAIISLSVVCAYSQDEEAFLDNSVFENPQRPVSAFDHDEHNEMAGLEDDCSVCHHVYEGKQIVEGESSEDSSCNECHSLKSTKENSIPLRTAYHKRCKSCHFDSGKGPVLCGECHIKK